MSTIVKFQLRVNESVMSDKPWPGYPMTESYDEALRWLDECRKEIRETWATPDESSVYIQPWIENEKGQLVGRWPATRLQKSGVVNIDM